MSKRTRAALTLPAHYAAEHSVRGAASVVLDLAGCTAHDAVYLPLGRRQVILASDTVDRACRAVGLSRTGCTSGSVNE